MPITRTTSFPTNVILSDALGSAASPSSYFGFGNALGTVVASTGPRIQSGTGTPNGVVTSPIGSLWINSTTGVIFANTDGATAWSIVGGPSVIGVVLAETTLSGTAASFSFTGISQVYRHLRVEGLVATNIAATGQELFTELNADTTAGNYYYQNNWGANGANNVNEAANRNGAVASGATAPANAFFNFTIDIYNYTSARLKNMYTTAVGMEAAAAFDLIARGSIWLSNAAVTRVDIKPNSADLFIAGCNVRLIGIT